MHLDIVYVFKCNNIYERRKTNLRVYNKIRKKYVEVIILGIILFSDDYILPTVSKT
jgi:hypothetical protein